MERRNAFLCSPVWYQVLFAWAPPMRPSMQDELVALGICRLASGVIAQLAQRVIFAGGPTQWGKSCLQ